ncbi:MAG: MoaD/ThiS family protein [Candidatus Lokiarchaeota archaeon]|nr:MoaD/ThiS family protein [Candidatus Lokiarchaeota archaeon]
MIDVKIYFLSLLADITNIKELNLSIQVNSTIKEILKILISKFGKDFERKILDSPDSISKYIILGLNGKDIRTLENLDTIVNQHDEILLLPAIAGG